MPDHIRHDAPSRKLAIPLAGVADAWLAMLARETGATALTAIDGATLLGERAMLAGLRVPGAVSAGGGCRLYAAQDGTIALNLVRPDDRALLPALFAVDAVDGAAVAGLIARYPAELLVERGRLLGLAIAAEHEPTRDPSACTMSAAAPRADHTARAPRVLDLSALWAGPLAAHLLWLAGAEVVKVESRTRPDAMRSGNAAFFALLNQGKASVQIDLDGGDSVRALRTLIGQADIVIEAARPRGLLQFGIDADMLVRATPGLTWVSITAHGTDGDAANWVGFGDDVAVAAGLGAALRAASGRSGFVGDAIADPLTGMRAALAAWRGWRAGDGGRIVVSMRAVAAAALAEARADPDALDATLRDWNAAAGAPFPAVAQRASGPVAPLGADNERYLAGLAAC